jgi:integrase
MAEAPDLDAFAEWLRAEGKRPATVSTYLCQVRAFLREATDPLDVAAWARRRLARVPANTAGVVRWALRAWLRFHDIDPTSVRMPAGAKSPRRLRRALSDAELAAHDRAVDGRVRSPAVRVLLWILPRTGLRIGEACALRVDDLVEREGVRGLLVRVGKGGHQRFVPLLPEAAGVVDAYLTTTRQRAGWLFPGRNGNHIRPDSVRGELRHVRPDASITPHVLRHTFATRCQRGGMDLVTLSEILGHAQLATTRLYLHGSPGAASSALKRAWGAR